jgi:hypothetical protein
MTFMTQNYQEAHLIHSVHRMYVVVRNVAATAWAVLASFQVASDAVVAERVPASRRIRLRQHLFANRTLSKI